MDGPDVAAVNKDAPALPTVSIASAVVVEGTGASVPMSFPVTLSPASTQVVTVGWEVVFGTATSNDIDQATGAGSITFQPTETSKNIVINVIGDSTVESTETFTVRLTNVTNAAIGVQSATGTIADNDTAAGPCSPRPNILISTARSGTDQIVVTVKAGYGTIKKITFGSALKPLGNAVVETIGPSSIITGTGTFTAPAGVTQQSFVVRRLQAHTAVMVGLTIEDGCGEWKTFIGTGPEAF